MMRRAALTLALSVAESCTSWQTVSTVATPPAMETAVTGEHGSTHDERNVRVRLTDGREMRVNAAIMRGDTVLAIGGVDTLRFPATQVRRVQRRQFDRTRSVVAGTGAFAVVLLIGTLMVSNGPAY